MNFHTVHTLKLRMLHIKIFAVKFVCHVLAVSCKMWDDL